MKSLIKYLIVFLLAMPVVSCDHDEPDMPTDIDVPNNNGTDNEKEEQQKREQLIQLVKSSVTTTASYYDYCWEMRIESTLQAKLPGHEIVFGFGCGELENGIENVMLESHLKTNRTCSIDKWKSGDTDIIVMKVPFWYYYMFGTTDQDPDTVIKCDIMYASYLRLKGKDYWDKEEQEEYRQLIYYFDKYEEPTRWEFQPSIWVYIDDNPSIMIARYRRK